jgi:hypothetical protein
LDEEITWTLRYLAGTEEALYDIQQELQHLQQGPTALSAVGASYRKEDALNASKTELLVRLEDLVKRAERYERK